MKKPSVETTASIASALNSGVSGITSDRGKETTNTRERKKAEKKAKLRLAFVVGGLLVILCFVIGILVGYSTFRKRKGEGSDGTGGEGGSSGPFGGDREAVCSFTSGNLKGDLRLLYDDSSSRITTEISGIYLITSSRWDQMGVPYKLFVLRYSDMSRCLSKAVKPSDLFHFRPPMPPPDNSAADPTLTAKLGEIKDLALPDDKRSKTGAEMVEGGAVTVDRKKMLLGRVVAVIAHSADRLFESQTCCVIARAGSPL